MMNMATVKKNERFVPIKNYVVVVLVIIGIIALVLYGFSWHKVIQENRVSTSYLIKSKVISNEMQSIEELKDVFSEAPSDYYLYISYTGSQEIYDMEKELTALINEYKIGEQFYYLNVTDVKNEKDYINKINEALGLKDKKVINVPTIIYFKDGKAVDIIKKDGNNIMNIGDFQKLLDVNKVDKDQ